MNMETDEDIKFHAWCFYNSRSESSDESRGEFSDEFEKNWKINPVQFRKLYWEKGLKEYWKGFIKEKRAGDKNVYMKGGKYEEPKKK